MNKKHTLLPVFFNFQHLISEHDANQLLDWARDNDFNLEYILWTAVEKPPFEQWVRNVNKAIYDSGVKESSTVMLEMAG